MPRYRKHSPTVEAYQLDDTPTSQRHLINWGKGHITFANGNSVFVNVKGQQLLALPGDFILMDEDGNFSVWDQFTFADEYGLVL